MKTPRPYQLDAINFGIRRNVLICDDPGLGKTLDAIEVALRMRKASLLEIKRWRVLVVCPKRIREQWVQEIQDQDPYYPLAPINIIDGALPFHFQFRDMGKNPFGWFIIHYDVLAKRINELKQYVWDLVVADEAHRLANRSNKWTIAIKKIQAGRKIGLTGTPMEKSAADIWSPANWLYPTIYTSYWSFFKRFVETKPVWGTPHEKISGSKNTVELGKLLERFVIQRSKQQVAKEIPPNIIQRVPIRMDLDQRKAYDAIEGADDLLVQVDGVPETMVISNTLTKIVRLQQISSLPALLGSSAGSAKIEWTLDWLKDNPNRPVIIFSKFRGVIEHLIARLGEKRVDVVMGGVPDLPQRFLDGEVNILLGTIAAMSEGLNLQRAEVAIFIDQHWSTRLMEQAINRIHRMNITEPKLTYYLYNQASVDIKLVLPALDAKWSDHEIVYEAINQWRSSHDANKEH